MKIKGIMFDKDGTLIDMREFWYAACYETAIDILRICEVEENKENIDKMLFSCGFDKCKNILPGTPMQSGTNDDVIDSFVRQVLLLGGKCCSDLHDKCIKCFHQNISSKGNVVPTADLKLLFNILKEKGIKLCVATSDEFDITSYCLEKLEVKDMFDMIITADTVKQPKPNPESAYKFCEKFDIKPNEVIMVGDAENDMIFANNAGVHGILYDADCKSEITCAERVIDSLERLPEIVDLYEGQA